VEKLLLLNPADPEDLDHANALFRQGWNTDTELVLKNDDGVTRLFLHISFCDGCATTRQEMEADGEFDDDDEYERERRRKLAEFEEWSKRQKENDPELPPF
jgi:hypothetical protein